jgi:hypothetical protein
MTPAIEVLRARLEGLMEEQRSLSHHLGNAGRRIDLASEIRALERMIGRLEANRTAFTDRRAELAARFYEFARNGGR